MSSDCDKFIQIDSDDEEERAQFLKKYTKMINEPFEYIEQTSGKEIRKMLSNIINYWFNLSNDKVDEITSLITKIHNTSLLLDDIQDNSYIRRAKPAAHRIFGAGRTFESVNHVLHNIHVDVSREHRLQVKLLCEKSLIIALKGQIMDTYWRDNLICPTEEQYIDMICKKTGVMFRLIVSLFQEYSGKREHDFSNFCDLISMYFQITDDYFNLKSTVYFEKKGYCEDITEGKFSYPVIGALLNQPGNNRLLEILKMHTVDDEVKKECLDLIEEYGGFDHTKNKLLEIHRRIEKELEKLGGQEINEALFKTLTGHEDGFLHNVL